MTKEVKSHLISRGDVASDPKNDPAFLTENFLALLVVLNHKEEEPILDGFTSIVDCHYVRFNCVFKHIKTKIDRRNGQNLDNSDKPKSLRSGDVAIVLMQPL